MRQRTGGYDLLRLGGRGRKGESGMSTKTTLWIGLIMVTVELCVPPAGIAQEQQPSYLRDRGEGIPLSMFGTYIRKGEFIVYPYYEYYYDQDSEYKPEELGYTLNRDFRGRYRAHEGLIFLGYGITHRLAVEFEAAIITATQHKSKDDPSDMPDKLEESGLGDVESQLRWRWSKETLSRPELFSYFETVFPLQKDRTLIGTQDWELKLGTGTTKGFGWGTMTLRVAMEYAADESKMELGEYAIEYLRRVSRFFRFYVGVEGSQDEVELIIDLQFHVSPYAFIRINNAFGATSKATDYAPELGVLFHF
jgi:hypothetical protein